MRLAKTYRDRSAVSVAVLAKKPNGSTVKLLKFLALICDAIALHISPNAQLSLAPACQTPPPLLFSRRFEQRRLP